jgi:hypothetical protein
MYDHSQLSLKKRQIYSLRKAVLPAIDDQVSGRISTHPEGAPSSSVELHQSIASSYSHKRLSHSSFNLVFKAL